MKQIKIQVPSTTANIGPGFDILGAALNLYNYIELKESDKDIINIKGSQNTIKLSKEKDNLVYKCIKRVFDECDIKIPYLDINIDVNIPLSRGLGSSSTAIVGGLFIANEFIGNKLSKEDILELSVSIEGHPDNVAPCLLGGIVISNMENNKVYTQTINTKLELKFVVVIPEFELSTEKSRNVLPKEIPFKDAVFNSSKLAFLLQGLLNNDIELLRISLKDKLHEQYRGSLIKGFDDIKKIALENRAIGSVLSGAGPTILALTLENEENIAQSMKSVWSELGINSEYKILKLNSEGTKSIQ